MKKRLIIATANRSKLHEIRNIFESSGLRIDCLANLKKKVRLVENGKTFAENAVKKALPVSKAYPYDYVVGEDSGLSVDFLKGSPGVYSKRYAGRSGDQERNNNKLLKALESVSVSKRGAEFCCALALAKNGKVIKMFEGKLRGRISLSPKGLNGFGYDPVFYLPFYRKTVAQLPFSTKNKISHRAKAFGKLKKYLSEL